MYFLIDGKTSFLNFFARPKNSKAQSFSKFAAVDLGSRAKGCCMLMCDFSVLVVTVIGIVVVVTAVSDGIFGRILLRVSVRPLKCSAL